MPAIKINLNRLIELFGKSVNSDLPESVRALAARLMTLTAHAIRIDHKVDASVKTLSEQIAALTEIVQTLVPAEHAAVPAASVVDGARTGGFVPPVQPESTAAEQEEPSADDEFEARLLAESAAEVAAINDAAPVAEVTPLPRSKKAGGAK